APYPPRAFTPPAVTLFDYHHLIDIPQRRRHRPEDSRRGLQHAGQLLEQRLQFGRIVKLPPGFRLFQDRLRFRHPLGLNGARLRQAHGLDLRRFGAAFGFHRGGAAQAFLLQLFLLRFRQGNLRGLLPFRFQNRRLLLGLGAHNGGLPLGLRRLDDRSLKLLLLTQDFLLLHGNLFLGARPFHANFFRHHGLLGFGLRQGTGLRGLGLFHFDLGLVLRLPYLEVALGVRNIGVGVK